MDEAIDILTKTGEFTGRSCPKSEIHKKGHYHNTSHIWLYTKDGKILLQQRAFSKLICPGLWDVSVAGHVDSGETVRQAAVRETKEELDLFISENELKFIGRFECFQTYENGMVDNEFHNTFISQLNVNLNSIKISKAEVEAVKLVSIQEFEDLLNKTNNNHFVDSNRDYYKVVLKAIKNRINKRPKD